MGKSLNISSDPNVAWNAPSVMAKMRASTIMITNESLIFWSCLRVGKSFDYVQKSRQCSFRCSVDDNRIIVHLMFTCCLQPLHKYDGTRIQNVLPLWAEQWPALTPGGRTRPVIVSRVLHIRPFSRTVKYFIWDRWNPNLSCELWRCVTDPFSNQAVSIFLHFSSLAAALAPPAQPPITQLSFCPLFFADLFCKGLSVIPSRLNFKGQGWCSTSQQTYIVGIRIFFPPKFKNGTFANINLKLV